MNRLKRPSFTLGIEEEFQVIDPETRALRSHIQEMFTEGEVRLGEQIKREMHDSVIEVGTPICQNIQEARAEVSRLRGEILGLCREKGFSMAAAGTHPFTHWADVPIVEAPRYLKIVSDLGMIARANLIFGLHVHVAVEDDEQRIHILNQARYFLPHVLALSVNSPFWCGRETGWKSYRTKVFERFPRTGIPDPFRSWGEYEEYVNLLVRSDCIDTPKKIWWDVRIHPEFPTIEYRVCDVPMRIEETLCFAAIFQALTLTLWKLHRNNMSWRLYRRSLIAENKTRAARWGLDDKLVDFGISEQVPTRTLIEEILELIAESADELGCREEVEYARTIMDQGTGADRQLQVYRETGSLEAVVDHIMEETAMGATTRGSRSGS
jgi:glutamate---cysteine ligase / carboxylate-amine ligase